MAEIRKREIAHKVRIGEILKGKPQLSQTDGRGRLNFLELGDKKIVRVNVIANVIEKYISEGEKKFASLTLDDATGQIKLRIEPIEDAFEMLLGPTGSLGPGEGSWLTVRYRRKFVNESIAAYDGKTGRQLWMRDHLGVPKTPATKFLMHIPTAVYDVDGNGTDDLLAAAENHYGVISVRDNRDIVPAMAITATVPGHPKT